MSIFYQSLGPDGRTNLNRSIRDRTFYWKDVEQFFPEMPSKENLPTYLSRKCPTGFQIWGIQDHELLGKDGAPRWPVARDDFLFLIERINRAKDTEETVGDVPYLCRILHAPFKSEALSRELWEKGLYSNILLLQSYSVALKWEKLRSVLGYEKDHQPQYFRKYIEEKNWRKKPWNRDIPWSTPDSYAKELISAATKARGELLNTPHGESLVLPNADDPYKRTPVSETERPEKEWKSEETIETRIEGGKESRTIWVNERDPRIIEYAKTLASASDELRCEACSLSFHELYGDELGKGFIEAHHRRPFDGQERELRLTPDAIKEYIALLCSNCHRMIHRRSGMTVEELRRIVKKNKEGCPDSGGEPLR